MDQRVGCAVPRRVRFADDAGLALCAVRIVQRESPSQPRVDSRLLAARLAADRSRQHAPMRQGAVWHMAFVASRKN